MAHGRSTELVSMIKWIRTSRMSTKKSLSVQVWEVGSGSVRKSIPNENPHLCTIININPSLINFRSKVI